MEVGKLGSHLYGGRRMGVGTRAGWRQTVSRPEFILRPPLQYGEGVAPSPFTQDTRQALVKHEHLYLIYILTICT